MNVKKTKKFEENCPENYHVHDKLWIVMTETINHQVFSNCSSLCNNLRQA